MQADQLRFFTLLQEHHKFTLYAGLLLGLDDQQLLAHDLSLYAPQEFPHFARQLCGDKANPSGFTKAFQHHIRHNPHHWQHYVWVGGACALMPEAMIKEMVVDWLAWSKAQKGTWNIAPVISQMLPSIRLHPESYVMLLAVLSSIGYYYDADTSWTPGLSEVFRD